MYSWKNINTVSVVEGGCSIGLMHSLVRRKTESRDLINAKDKSRVQVGYEEMQHNCV